MGFKSVLYCLLLSGVFTACASPSEGTSVPSTITPIPPTELPSQCSDTNTTYELRRTTEQSAPQILLDGIASPQGNWIAHTDRQTLMLTKNDSNLELRFDLPSVGGTRAEEQLVWSPDERWVALHYRFQLGKGETQYYLGVYGVNGIAYDTLAITRDLMPRLWTETGLLFTRQPLPQQFTLMQWNSASMITLAENLTLPPFYAPDGQLIALFDGNELDMFNIIDGSHSIWIEGVSGLENLVWSPEEQIAALKLSTTEGESLSLVFADGRASIVLRTGLSGLGDPLWSPDGQMLAFTQAVDNSPIELHIVTVTRTDLWQFNALPLEWTLDWFACS